MIVPTIIWPRVDATLDRPSADLPGRNLTPSSVSSVVAARQVRFYTPPSPIANIGDQTRAHGTEFHVSRDRHQMGLAHDERSEPPLPWVAPPFFTEVDPPCVPSIALADALRQAVLRLRHGNQVHVTGHEAARPNVDPSPPHQSAITSSRPRSRPPERKWVVDDFGAA